MTKGILKAHRGIKVKRRIHGFMQKFGWPGQITCFIDFLD